MITIVILICGIFLLIKGKTSVYGGQIVEGKLVRLLGTALVLLSIISFFVPGKFGWGILGLSILLLILFYFWGKGRNPTEDEKTWSSFSSKSEEAETFKLFGKGVLILVVVLGVLFGGFWLLLYIIGKIL